MFSTSLSQVFLHLSTLEKAVTWSKSVLHTRCKLCRRKGDPEKMLLCDQCDRGHHMYCLKPALKVFVDFLKYGIGRVWTRFFSPTIRYFFYHIMSCLRVK